MAVEYNKGRTIPQGEGNRVLTEDEIKQLCDDPYWMIRPKKRNWFGRLCDWIRIYVFRRYRLTDGLVGCWIPSICSPLEFDGTDRLIVLDRSGNGNHGRLVGFEKQRMEDE